MKRIFTFLVAVLSTASVFAQSPNKMSYQAVVRNISNNLITNQAVGMKISILQGSISGTSVYEEIFNPNPITNSNGLVTVEIGGGIPLFGNFSTIDWSAGPYFIKTETDPTGGTNYTIIGVSQLLSVPYALHAKTAETVTGGITETDPIFGASLANGIVAGDITNWNSAFGCGNHAIAGYLTSFTETDPLWSASPSFGITNMNISNWSTSFGWGNHATAGYLTSFAETDPLWSASPSFGITNTNVSNWNTAFGWGNHATAGYLTTESQTLSLNGNELSISGGDTVTLPSGGGSGGFQIFTSSGTFTVPVGVTQIIVEGWGGGGSSCYNACNPQGNRGGGGGAYGKTFISVIPNDIINITVGVGGAGGITNNVSYVNGSAGTPTVIGSYLTIGAGGGGSSTIGGIGGTCSAIIAQDENIGDGQPNVQAGGVGGLRGGQSGTTYGNGGAGGSGPGWNNGGNGSNGLVMIFW